MQEMRKMKNQILFVIPCYNEARNVIALFEGIHTISNGCLKENGNTAFLLLNNGCTDNTFDLVARLMPLHENCCSILLMSIEENFGLGFGLKSVLARNVSTNIAILPADGKYDYNAVSHLVDLYWHKSDFRCLVKGQRVNRNDPKIIQTLSDIYNRLVGILLRTGPIDVNGLPKIFYNAFSETEINLMSNNACFDASLLSIWHRKNNYTQEVPIQFTQQLDETPSWSGNRFRTSFRMFRELLKCRGRIRKYL
jgi:hypothetical protein